MYGRPRQAMIRPNRLNRIPTVATLPLMAVVIVFASRAVSATRATADPPQSGLLIVANLRDESLSILDLATSRTTVLALPGPPHEMAAAGGRVYITLGRANLLLEIDPNAPGILRSLPLDGEPHGLAIEGEAIFVTLDRANALVTIDRPTLTETHRTPTGDTPHAVAVDRGTIFVTSSRDNLLNRYPGDRAAQTGELPESVAIVGPVAVTGNAGSRSLSVFSLESLDLVREVDVRGAPVRLLPLGDHTVLAALNDEARAAVVDTATGKVKRRLPTPGHPDGLCLDPAGEYLAVASNESDGVSFFRVKGWVSAGSVPAGDGPGACLWLPPR